MDIFSVFTLCGGLAFFLYGMTTMSKSLEKMAGGKLERLLKKMTSNPFKSLLLGAGITIAIQSSSAMTVMLVGLVNSGIMQLGQTVGVIMGSNIGTTLTAWILSLSGIQSDVFWLRLLKPENFSPIFAMVGVTLIMASKSTRRKDVGSILVGFSVLMFGMNLMSSAVSPLADVPEFANLLIVFKNPLVGVLVGTVFTGIIQSSAASVGILQALSLTGGISYGMAIPIIMGQNIGTCVTALLSSIGVNKNAKRVAVVHISFNIIGTILCLSVFYGVNALFPLPFIDNPIDGVGIAAVHSIFNIVTTAVLLPFPKQLEKLANLVVKEDNKTDRPTFLDELLLRTPSIAVNESRSMTVRMANLARTSVLQAVSLFDTFDHKAADQILENESTLDWFEDQLGTYLLKLSGKELSDADSRQVSKIFLTIGDFERLGDHAVNLAKTARELFDKRLQFSAEAQHEVSVLTKALSEILELAIVSFAKENVEMASKVEPLSQAMSVIISQIRPRHVERLQKGECTIEKGFIYSDLLSNYARVFDHCSNIAAATIGATLDNFDTHEYLDKVKSQDNPNFTELYHAYLKQYAV